MGNAEERQVSLLIHSFAQSLLCTYYVPDTLPGAGSKWMAKTQPLSTKTLGAVRETAQ